MATTIRPWLNDSSSNRYIQTYMKGYLDISGGPLILRNAGVLGLSGDSSFNNNVTVGGRLVVGKPLNTVNAFVLDVSGPMNFGASDSSFGGNVTVNNNLAMGGLIQQNVSSNNTFNQQMISVPYSAFVGSGFAYLGSNNTFTGVNTFTSDASFSRLFSSAGSDASLGGNLFVNGFTTLNNDVSANAELMVGGDASLNGRLFVSADASMNKRLFLGSDASFGGRLAIVGDTSMNGNVTIGKNVAILGNLTVQAVTKNAITNTITTNVFNVVEDLSLNGRIMASSDASFGGRLFVGSDATFATDITVNGLKVGRGSGNVSTNTTLGNGALVANTTGSDNTAVGFQSLYALTTGGTNTAVGKSASSGLTTGSNNVSVGYLAGNKITTGSNNTAIGYASFDTNAAISNSTAIGYLATPTASNQIVLGTTTETVIVPNAMTATGLITANGGLTMSGSSKITLGNGTVVPTTGQLGFITSAGGSGGTLTTALTDLATTASVVAGTYMITGRLTLNGYSVPNGAIIKLRTGGGVEFYDGFFAPSSVAYVSLNFAIPYSITTAQTFLLQANTNNGTSTIINYSIQIARIA